MNKGLKSISIRDRNGKLLLKIKRMKVGVESLVLQELGELHITCVLEDNSRIKIVDNNRANDKM